jgi:hypothetical protein
MLCLCLLLPLTACNRRAPKDPAQSASASAPAAPWVPEAIPAIAGDESAPPAAPVGASDGLEGSYYNDFLRETLTLDGHGACALSWDGGVMGGTYERTENGCTLRLADFVLGVWADERGDLSIEGKQGSYLRDWDFWGITPAEAGIHPTNTLPDTEEFSLGGGAYRYRDYQNGLALTYDGDLQIAAGRLDGAVTVADGKGGYVVGRNVTRRYLTPGRSAEEFLEDYIKSDVFADFAALYGATEDFENLRILPGNAKQGRLAAGDLTLSGNGRSAMARVVLYASTYADGTENYIAKCVFAASAEEAEHLAQSVRDMGAARIVQTS